MTPRRPAHRAAELGDHFLAQSLGEVLVPGVVRHAGERQHGEPPLGAVAPVSPSRVADAVSRAATDRRPSRSTGPMKR